MNLSSFRPAYFIRRLAQARFAKAHPHAPWLAPSAVLLLETYLRRGDTGLEWGSGRSTVWLARRVRQLHSIEHEYSWFFAVNKELKAAGLADKVVHRLIPCELGEIAEPEDHPYAAVAASLPDGSLDFALVDGSIRLSCVTAIVPKLAPGGLLVLDNANRFLPNSLGVDFTTVHEQRAAPRSPAWARVADELRDWRCIGTTDGIWDTRFWIKPLAVSSAPRPATRTPEWARQD